MMDAQNKSGVQWPFTVEMTAICASVGWLVICAIAVWLSQSSLPSGFIMLTMVAGPLGVIWTSAYFSLRVTQLKAEMCELQAQLAQAVTEDYSQNHGYHSAVPVYDPNDVVPDPQPQPYVAVEPEPVVSAIDDAMDDDVESLAEVSYVADDGAVWDDDSSPAQPFTASSMVAAEEASHEGNVDSLSNAELICGFNFPDDADDEQSFAALRRALAHPELAQSIQAAQDMLTLLSQDNIYMDDLSPDLSDPELWRQFASGERGVNTLDLARLQDRTPLEVISRRMRYDTIFQDAAHHFLRRVDKSFASVAPTMDDEELLAFCDTRSMRAFMCVGRAAKMFD